MELVDRPTVRELLATLKLLERAVGVVLDRLSDKKPIAEDDAEITTIQFAATTLSGLRGYEELSKFLGMGVRDLRDHRVNRAKVRFAEALHVAVNAPIRLLERHGTQRSQNPETEESKELEKPNLGDALNDLAEKIRRGNYDLAEMKAEDIIQCLNDVTPNRSPKAKGQPGFTSLDHGRALAQIAGHLRKTFDNITKRDFIAALSHVQEAQQIFAREMGLVGSRK